MLGESALVGAAVGNDNPLPDDQRIPSERRNDLLGKAPPAIRHHEEVVGIDQLGLQLHEEKRPARRAPRDKINDAALPEVVERDLGADVPLDANEQARDGLRHRGMAGGEKAIESGATPAGIEHEANLERSCDTAQPAEGHSIDPTSLDLRVRAAGDSGFRSDGALRPPESMAELPEHAPDREIIHGPMIVRGTYLAIAQRTGPFRIVPIGPGLPQPTA